MNEKQRTINRVVFGCVAIVVLILGLAIFAAKAGYLDIRQDLSSGSGDDGN